MEVPAEMVTSEMLTADKVAVLNEDEMCIRDRAWNARQNKKKSEQKPGLIDTVWPGVRPG